MRVSVKHYCLNCCRFAIVDSRHSSCSKRAHKTGMFVKMMSTEQHVDAVKSKNNIIKTIKSDVFVALKQLTNDTRAVRVKGAIDLLQQLHKKQNQSDENTVRMRQYGHSLHTISQKNSFFDFCGFQIDKNRQYSLQRLVRGLGASSSSSRTGFYTAFVGLLSQPLTDNEYPSINHVIDVMEKELSVSKVGCNNKVSIMRPHGYLFHSKYYVYFVSAPIGRLRCSCWPNFGVCRNFSFAAPINAEGNWRMCSNIDQCLTSENLPCFASIHIFA